MNKSKIINTPLGKVEVKQNATPSSNATVTIMKMKSRIEKIAISGIIPAGKLKEDEPQYNYAAE